MRLWAALGASATTSDLYTVDPSTGAMTSVGPTGFALTGLAFDPTTGILYGATSNNSVADSNALVTIDPTTGAGTLVGTLTTSDVFPIADICFSSSGQMYGWGQSRVLVSIDKATAAVTDIGTVSGGTAGGGISAASDDTLYAFNRYPASNFFYAVDAGTGALTTISSASVKCNAASFDASDVLYAVQVPNSGAVPATLVTVDLGTGAATTIGVMTNNTDALAWETAIVVPPPPPVSPRATYEWRFAVTKLNLRVLSWLDRVSTQRQVTYTLNKPATATGVVPSDNPAVNLVQSDGFRILDEGVRCLIGFRREGTTAPKWVCRFAGIVEQVEDNVNEDGGVAPYSNYTAYDPKQLLYARPVRKADGSLPGADGVTFTSQTGNAIVLALLSRSLTADGQHYVKTTGGTIQTTDVISKITFQQGSSVGEALDQLAADGNLDVVLDALYDPVGSPSKLATLNIYKLAGYSSGGVPNIKHKAPLAWDKPRRNLVGVNRLKDGTQRANRIQYYTGAGGPRAGTVSAFGEVANYGTYWAQQFFSGGSRAAVGLLAAEQLLIRKRGVRSYKVNPVPGSLGQINSPILFLDYALGTLLPIFASGRFRKKIAVAKRVISIPVVIRDDGVETISQLEFGDGEEEIIEGGGDAESGGGGGGGDVGDFFVYITSE